MNRRGVLSLALLGLLLVTGEARARRPPVPSLWLTKLTFRPGELMKVGFMAHGHYAKDAWVGIVPSRIGHGSEARNDRYDLVRQFLNKRTSGHLYFRAPRTAGKYDIRMNDTDRNGREVASVSFTVAGRAIPGTPVPLPRPAPVTISGRGNTLTLNGYTFPPGGRIVVRFTASPTFASSAWVGIIPSRVPHGSERVNDRYDVSYQYIRKRTHGVMVFRAPRRAGSWDFRMHDTDANGREVASVTFTVKGGAKVSGRPGLYLKKATFSPGQLIRLKFTASNRYPNDAWVGIVPSYVSHGSEVINDRNRKAFQYLRGRTSGTLYFRAPRKAGQYDFRMNDTDRNGREVASVSFTVAKASSASAKLRLTKYKYRPGEVIKVWFSASSRYASNAWVGIIPSRVPHGSEAVNDRHDLAYRYLRKRTYGTLTFRAPRRPGSYDFRMHDTDSNGREVYSITFKVTGP